MSANVLSIFPEFKGLVGLTQDQNTILMYASIYEFAYRLKRAPKDADANTIRMIMSDLWDGLSVSELKLADMQQQLETVVKNAIISVQNSQQITVDLNNTGHTKLVLESLNLAFGR